MNDYLNELFLLLKARTSIVNIVGYDENRIIQDLTQAVNTKQWTENEGLYSWDIADQFVCHHPGSSKFDISRSATPDTILTLIDEFKGGAIFVLKDFHQIWEAKKSVIRKLRNLSVRLGAGGQRKNIVITTPEFCLPLELKHDVVCLECPKPDIKVMDQILERVAGSVGALKGVKPELRDKIIENALGLSATQAQRTFLKAIVSGTDSRLSASCIDLILAEKQQIIRESGALELYSQTELKDHVGGLTVLKEWLSLRKMAFTEAAKRYPLDAPRGLALIGIPGTGKSLCAKMTAGIWKMPLLRLDMGAIFGGILGASEKNVREAVQISEVISPCILWVDEIEKAFAGSSGDSGTSSRVLGFFLTWMAEKKHPVFVFATANNIEHLPPEFLRKGRFDEVFFLDLPTLEERQAILAVHLKKRGYSMAGKKFNIAQLAKETEGFVGAELEAVIKDAMFPAFMDQGRELTDADISASAGDMVPLAKSHREIVQKLRELVTRGLARNASAPATSQEIVELDRIRDARRFIDLEP